MTIGQAGENQVGIAGVASDGLRIHARCGGGAVLGSKNFKGIAVQGNGGIRIDQPDGLLKWSDEFRQSIDQNEAIYGFKRRGTLGAVEMYQHIGSHFWRNNQGNMFRGDEIRSDNWVKKYHKYSEVCSSDCFIACDAKYKIDGTESDAAKKYVGETFRRPEYLTTASAAGALDLRDWAEVAHWGKITNDYAIDNQDLSCSISFLMELKQRDLISEREVAELFGHEQSLEWGNMDDVEELVKDIVFQRNTFGEIFNDGPYKGALRYSEMMGQNFMKYAMYGKGGASFTEEMRPFPTWMNNMAVASRGADHLKGIGLIEKFQRKDLSQAYFNRPEAADLSTPLLKGASTALIENQVALLNSYGVCLFHWMLDPGGYMPEQYYGDAYRSITGVDHDADELMPRWRTHLQPREGVQFASRLPARARYDLRTLDVGTDRRRDVSWLGCRRHVQTMCSTSTTNGAGGTSAQACKPPRKCRNWVSMMSPRCSTPKVHWRRRRSERALETKRW